MKEKRRFVVAAAAVAVAMSAFAAGKVDFVMRRMLAGKASLTEGGFVVSRSFGTANFSPELRCPVELVYESASEKTGIFGYAWRSPQLESSAFWEKDGLLWTAPWGEKVKFFPKAEKTPKDAIKIDVIEEAKKDS